MCTGGSGSGGGGGDGGGYYQAENRRECIQRFPSLISSPAKGEEEEEDVEEDGEEEDTDDVPAVVGIVDVEFLERIIGRLVDLRERIGQLLLVMLLHLLVEDGHFFQQLRLSTRALAPLAVHILHAAGVCQQRQ